MKICCRWCLLLLLMITTACDTAKVPVVASIPVPDSAPTPVPSSSPAASDFAQIKQGKVAAATLDNFGLKLVANLAANRPHENMFVSPLSIFAALAMLENGADGKTRTAMR